MIVNSCWIDGQEIKPNDDLPVEDPAERSIIAKVPIAGSREVSMAVDSASKAFTSWKSTSSENRSRCVKRLALEIKNREKELSLLLSRETGKPITSAKSEVESAVEFLLYCAEEVKRLKGRMGEGFFVRHEPVGVCGIITPFNYPLSTLVTKIGPALSVGCSVVVKPDEHTPLTTLALAKLSIEAGFPQGVINVVTGPGEPTGEAVLAHPGIRAISFTGSTEVGKRIYERSSLFVRRLVLELGGNCPAVIAQDARWKFFINPMVKQAFKNSGQYCYRITRFIIHDSVYDEFVGDFLKVTSSLKVGHPLDPTTDLGPLNNRRILERFCRQVKRIHEAGAKLLTGTIPDIENIEGGYYCNPIVFSEIPEDLDVSEEEFFGPVVFLFRYSSDEKALKLANSPKFGLAAYIFTENQKRASFWVNNLEVGSVWVNSIHQARFDAPFGGYKESGLGREKSPYGFEAFTELKTVYWRIF